MDIGVSTGGELVARYAVAGEIDRLRIPARGERLDPDRLWAHTCCELFVAPASGDGYLEWNFSPTGQVARFEFSAYRTRSSSPGASTVVGDSTVSVHDRELRLEARVPLPPHLGDTARIALTAVLEDASGTLSYWALRHPCDRPDFHRLEGFVLALTMGPPIEIVHE